MKKLLVLIGLVAVLAATAASSSGSAQADALAPADTLTVNTFFPITLLVFVPCANGGAGEDVLLSGTLHDLFHITINDNSLHVKTHDQPQGISGTGLVTGDKYQATGVTQDEFNTSFGAEETFINNFRIIGQGNGNNFLVHENFHVTINANGTVTALHDNFSIDCK
jgi:hypothetical protein